MKKYYNYLIKTQEEPDIYEIHNKLISYDTIEGEWAMWNKKTGFTIISKLKDLFHNVENDNLKQISSIEALSMISNGEVI